MLLDDSHHNPVRQVNTIIVTVHDQQKAIRNWARRRLFGLLAPTAKVDITDAKTPKKIVTKLGISILLSVPPRTIIIKPGLTRKNPAILRHPITIEPEATPSHHILLSCRHLDEPNAISNPPRFIGAPRLNRITPSRGVYGGLNHQAFIPKIMRATKTTKPQSIVSKQPPSEGR